MKYLKYNNIYTKSNVTCQPARPCSPPSSKAHPAPETPDHGAEPG